MKLYLGYKIIRRVINNIMRCIHNVNSIIIFWGNNVRHKNFSTTGSPYVSVARSGICIIGNNFRMNNGIKGNPIGCSQRCSIFVDRGAKLLIGDNVGISQTALICHERITIGNNVTIGGGVCIYDTDFHSLHPELRMKNQTDIAMKKPVTIKDNVFIGAHSIILKGVTIGENTVIGACSVVTKSIPENEIWAGNPARFIKKINL